MKRILSIIALVSLVFGGGCVQKQDQFGSPESGGQWIVFSQFDGYQTKVDPEKVQDGANPQGQNTTANHRDRISIRPQGFDLFPSSAFYSSTSTGVETMHTFRKRDGSSILMRTTSSTMEWYDSHGTFWETLKTGYTSGDFGFSDNNVNTDQNSYTYFGNSYEPFSRWTGAKTYFTAAPTSTATVLFVNDTTDFLSTTGTIVYCGMEIAYLSKTATTFTVVSAHVCDNGRAVAEAVQEFSDQSLYPRGNIYLFADNRLWISGTTSTQNIVYFSGYGTSTQFDLTSLVASSTAADPGLFNLAEGGGPVTALVMDEGSVYIFKRLIIYKATLTDTIYTIQPLKSFDQKSQTTGAVSKRSTFTSGNGVFFITPDNQIMMLDRVEYIDYPQITPISDIIKPTIDGIVFSTSTTGIVFRNKAYFAAKTTNDVSANDVVFVYDIDEKMWDSPLVGWNIGDWAIYQDSSKEDLYFGDAITDNVYSVTDSPEDYIYDTAASWRSKQYTFGVFHGLKYMSNVYVEGYIAPDTELTISLLLDEDGYTRQYRTTLSGNESTYIYNSSLYNLFGLLPFGTTRFGAQEDLSGKRKFRIYLGKNFQQIPFYNAQIEFASDGQNQNWEVDNYGFYVYQAPVPEKASLFKAFQ